MSEVSRDVKIASNVFKTRALRTIYFENSVVGKALGLMGVRYMTHAEKVDTLSMIRMDNNSGHKI